METKTTDSKTTPMVIEKNIADNILNRVKALSETGGLQIPKNYSAENALKSAWLMLQNTVDKEKNPVLTVCKKESIANCLFDMVIQGLSPAKRQCYFIAYGAQLTLSRSYFGSIAVTKSLKGIKEVFANVIYKDDVFEYELDLNTGLKKITKHEQKFQNIDNSKIVGAYAVINRDGLPPYIEIMNMAQITSAWKMGKQRGEGDVHKNFTEEMAKKSVINRACKTFWNTSDDSDLLIEAIHRSTDVEDIPETPYVDETETDKIIAENSVSEELDIQEEQPEKPKGIGWEKPIEVIAAIEKISVYQDAVKFKKENAQRLDSFGGKDADLIVNALTEKINTLNVAYFQHFGNGS